MNYQKHYELLIMRAKSRVLETYSEKHHIVPKCIGGSNKRENLVSLTPEEHYFAHQLLMKIYPNKSKLTYAAHAMSNMGKIKQKEYAWIKRKRAKVLSETRSGVNHPGFGKPGTMTGKKHTKEALEKMQTLRINKNNMKKLTGIHSPNFGKKRNEQSKLKMKKPKPEGFGKGENNSNFGKHFSDKSKEKMRLKAKNRAQGTCIHCGKTMAVSHIAKYHNDKCKYLREVA